jgi:hypothetical protein
MASRVLRRGGRIGSLPELGAEYTPRNSLRALARQYRRYGMYRAKTTLRHPWTVRAPHIVLPGVVSAAAARWSRRGPCGRRPVPWSRSTAPGSSPRARAPRRTRGTRWRCPWCSSRCTHRGAQAFSSASSALPRRRAVEPAWPPISSSAPGTGERAPARLAVYLDYVHRRDAGGLRSTRVRAVRRGVAGRVRAGSRHRPGRSEPDRSHYPVPAGIRFVELPHYASAADALELARAIRSTLRRWDAVLRDVDVVCVLGPQGLALPLVLLARLREKRVVLGVRQHLPSYARSRHPGAPRRACGRRRA